MKNFVAIAIAISVIVIFTKTAFAAPEIAEILADTKASYTFAKDWFEDLLFSVLGFLAFTGIIAFWLKGAR